MLLPQKEAELFFKLYLPLLCFAYGKNIPAKKDNQQKFLRARAILCGNARQIIDNFIAQNPNKLEESELALVKTWKNFVKGDFVVLKNLNKHTIVMRFDSKSQKFYGILGLNEEVIDMVPYGLAGIFSGLLLPWLDKIIWDGLVMTTGASIGPSYFYSFNQNYQQAKKDNKVITKLN